MVGHIGEVSFRVIESISPRKLAEGPQLDSCDTVRYTDQCCIGLKWQRVNPSKLGIFWCCHELSQSPKAFKDLGLPSFNTVAFPSLSLHWNSAFEFDIVYHTWTRWRKPAASLHSGSTFCLQQSCSAQFIARALATFCLKLPWWRFSAANFGAARLSSSHFFSLS